MSRNWLHFKWGIHFGYPICCVLWYVFLQSTYHHFAVWNEQRFGPSAMGYVRCPTCAWWDQVNGKAFICWEDWDVIKDD